MKLAAALSQKNRRRIHLYIDIMLNFLTLRKALFVNWEVNSTFNVPLSILKRVGDII